MAVLEGLKPEKVFHFFEKLCEIPHGSTHMKEISDYFVSFAKERRAEPICADTSFVLNFFSPGSISR